MNESSPATAQLPDGPLDADAACANCGYNLRGLAPASACPECGMAVVVSLRRDRPGDAPRPWLRRMHRGAVALEVGVWAALPLVVPGLVIAAWGMWQLTRPQPGRPEPSLDRNHRCAARGMLGLALAGLAAVSVAVGVALWDQPFHGQWRVYDGSLIGAMGAWTLGLLAAWEHLTIFARRVPDAALARACRQAQWAWILGVGAITAVAGVASAADWLLAGPHGGGAWLPGLPWLMAGSMALIAAILLVLWMVTLRLARRLRACLRKLLAERE